MSDLGACRSCGGRSLRQFLSLGKTPLADNLVPADRLEDEEPVFPLDVAFCPDCTLVQITEEVPAHTLFVDNYLYFSSFSDALVRHAKSHVDGLVASREAGFKVRPICPAVVRFIKKRPEFADLVAEQYRDAIA